MAQLRSAELAAAPRGENALGGSCPERPGNVRYSHVGPPGPFGSSRLFDLEGRGVTDAPIGPAPVERLEAPVLPWPTEPQRPIAVVDVFHELWDRLPPQRLRDMRSHVDVDPGNDEVSAGIDQSCDVAKAPVGLDRLHMAQEVVRDHEIVTTENVHDLRITS